MGPLELTIRRAGAADEELLESMLALASNWRGGPGTVPRDDTLDRYLEGWGREGDLGLVASLEACSVGAAWWRRFSRDRAGYGFIDEDVSEITIAVEARHRRRGVGRALLEALQAEAQRQEVKMLSLSVEDDNPAVGLYRAAGFRRVAGSEGSATMAWP